MLQITLREEVLADLATRITPHITWSFTLFLWVEMVEIWFKRYLF